jgi:hypothetical protein
MGRTGDGWAKIGAAELKAISEDRLCKLGDGSEWGEGTFVQKLLDERQRIIHLTCMPRAARLDSPGVLHHIMGRRWQDSSG